MASWLLVLFQLGEGFPQCHFEHSGNAAATDFGGRRAILKEATARVASLRLRIAQDVRSAVAKRREQDNEVLELGGAVTVHITVRRPPR